VIRRGVLSMRLDATAELVAFRHKGGTTVRDKIEETYLLLEKIASELGEMAANVTTSLDSIDSDERLLDNLASFIEGDLTSIHTEVSSIESRLSAMVIGMSAMATDISGLARRAERARAAGHPRPPVSRSQLDQCGPRLRRAAEAGEPVPESVLETIDEYRGWHLEAVMDVESRLRGEFHKSGWLMEETGGVTSRIKRPEASSPSCAGSRPGSHRWRTSRLSNRRRQPRRPR
jgi:hypothetical protein